MKIGIIGTRGIPNQYGGFEQFAEIFSVKMVEKGHSMIVYSSHNHEYKIDSYKGVQLIHCNDPEHRVGTIGQFFYDLNCIKDSRKHNFDIILQLGYTSSTIWSRLYPKNALLVTNMDGLEWKRSKYSEPVRFFLKYAEKWAVKYSHRLIADSMAIQSYLWDKYQVYSQFIPYGAGEYTLAANAAAVLNGYKLAAQQYDLAIQRFEPENNIEILLSAYKKMPAKKLVVVGNFNATKFGRNMYEQYEGCSNILFTNGIYDQNILNVLRHQSRIYFHGHSVGGTNPSLLEAMACDSLICAHNNPFNKAVLNENAFYFSKEEDILEIAALDQNKKEYGGWILNNKTAIWNIYNWEKITDQIESYFLQWLKEKQLKK